ncbi:hypothetical protein COLO4_25618 [Corchorus olitorius]|uniref:NAC domain-containing protein n=1 Tax=Corchorus olitorius TaxID=93759 RepID=A0A1R3I139_9ROSI|nr:hypothetical protein COLO4_25618 [Corchorus olitorius]
MNGNRLSGNIPPSIGNMTELFELRLDGNSLEGSIPSILGNCSHLQVLNLSQNNFTGTIPKEVIVDAEDPNGDRKGETEWFFFTPRNRKYRNGSRPDRGAGDGYWKATGADKKVRHQGKIEGLKKTLVYHRESPKPPGGKKTNWIMHEYVLKDPPPRQRAGIEDMKLDNWVLSLPQIAVNQNQQHQNGGSKIMNQLQIAVDQKRNHENGGSNIMNPSQLIHQGYNNMMLPQATYPPMLPYYNNGYNAAASTSGFSYFPEYLGLGQDLPCYGNFVPTAAPILPPQFPSLPEIYGFTDDERNFWESQDFNFEQNEDKNETKTRKRL